MMNMMEQILVEDALFLATNDPTLVFDIRAGQTKMAHSKPRSVHATTL